MTNEEIIARMWEAYKAGIEDMNSLGFGNFTPERIRFDGWIEHKFPELLEQSKPRQTTYWHEYGCSLSHHTRNKTFGGLCQCIEPKPHYGGTNIDPSDVTLPDY